MELGYVLHTTIRRSNYYEYFMKKVHSSCKEIPLGNACETRKHSPDKEALGM